MTRRFVAVLLLFFVAIAPHVARGHTLSVQVKDKYVLGKGVKIYDGPVVQTDLLINLPRGFYVDLWWSAGLDNSDLDGGLDDEVDYTVGWAGKAKGLDLDFGVSYFDLIGLYSLDGGDVVQPYLDLGKSFQPTERHAFTPYIRAEVQIPIGWDEDAHNGVHLFGGLKHTWQAHERFSVFHKLALMYDTGTFVNSDHGFLGHYDLALNWRIADAVTVQLPTFRVVFPISDLSDGREVQHVVGGGVTITF